MRSNHVLFTLRSILNDWDTAPNDLIDKAKCSIYKGKVAGAEQSASAWVLAHDAVYMTENHIARFEMLDINNTGKEDCPTFLFVDEARGGDVNWACYYVYDEQASCSSKLTHTSLQFGFFHRWQESIDSAMR